MKRTTLFASSGSIVLCTGVVALAQLSGGGFDLSWHTIDSGGGTSEGGDYSLTGTTGQHDAGGPMTGGDFSLVGGFWTGAGEVTSNCPADLDDSGAVDFGDILAILASWGPCEGKCPEDLDGSGAVDFGDILAVLAAWGPCE